MPRSLTAFFTFARLFSNPNSGACTPITTSPASRYFCAQARTYGIERRQLMHEYVQKSTSTTLPFRPSTDNGGELIHSVAPASGGHCPPIGRGGVWAGGGTGRTLLRRLDRVDERLLEARRARQRKLREKAGVETERDRDDADEQRRA